MHELPRARIIEHPERGSDTRGSIIVVGETVQCALESLQWRTRRSWSAEQMVEILPSRHAPGMIKRDEHLVQVEILPGAIVECVDQISNWQMSVVGCDERHVSGPFSPVGATATREPVRNPDSGKEPRDEQGECGHTKHDGGEQAHDGGARHCGKYRRCGRSAGWCRHRH